MPFTWKKNNFAISLLLLGLVLWGTLQIIYFQKTSGYTRSYDLDAHMEHISMVDQGVLIPMAVDCMECYHPPLYYVGASYFHKNLAKIIPQNKEFLLKCFSLALTTLFYLTTLVLLREVFPNCWYFLISAFLIIFWPSGFIHGIRIGNDVPFYLLTALTFRSLYRWREHNQPKDFFLTAYFAFMSPFTKANGFLTLLSAGILIIDKLWERRDASLRLAWKKIIIISVLFMLSVGLYYAMSEYKGSKLNTEMLDNLLPVRNDTINFLPVVYRPYLETPFVDTHHDYGGRQNFWIFLLKTSLWGEFSFSRILWAKTTLFFLFVILGYTAWGMLLSFRINSQRIFWIWALVFILGAMIFRFAAPYSCSADFRYIYPIIIPWAVFFVNSLSFFFQKKHPYVAAIGILSLIIFLSAGTYTIVF